MDTIIMVLGCIPRLGKEELAMNTVVNVDVNELLMDIKRQNKTINSWKLLCYGLCAFAVYVVHESKELKEKNKTLTNELEGLKATKGE